MANTAQPLRSNGGATKEALRQDIQNLKQDASEFGEDLLNAGSEQFEELKQDFSKQMDSATKYVRSNPGQSVAIAFAAGALACLLLGRR